MSEDVPPEKVKRSKKTHDTTIFSFSHSGLESMESCLRKWYLMYIKGYFPKPKQPATEFGKLCHKIAEEYTGTGIVEARKLLEQYRAGHEISPEYETKLNSAISIIVDFHDKHLSKVAKVYKEKEIRIALSEYIDLLGSIDVLYKSEEDGWVVVDYKTSKKKSDYSKQLAFYYFLLLGISNAKPKKLKCQIVYLALDGQKDYIDEYELSQDELEFCEMRIQSAINRIMHLGVDNMGAWRKKVGPLCNYCNFKIVGYCDGVEHD